MHFFIQFLRDENGRPTGLTKFYAFVIILLVHPLLTLRPGDSYILVHNYSSLMLPNSFDFLIKIPSARVNHTNLS